MAKGRSHKSQHFIPRSYLEAWTDPATPAQQTPYVWLIDVKTGEARKKPPSNIFAETDLYTIPMPDGTRDLRVEQGLQQLETGIKALREDIFGRRKRLPLPRQVKLMAFMSALSHRTPGFRDHHREQWGRMVEIADEMQANLAKMTKEERRSLASMSLGSKNNQSMSLEQVKRIVEQPIQTLMPAALRVEVPILMQMRIAVLVAGNNASFITSDNPLVKFDFIPRSRSVLASGPTLASPTVQVTLPISPKMMIFMFHDQPPSQGVKAIEYRDTPDDVVEMLNYRTVAHAREYLVNNQNFVDKKWIFVDE